MSIEMTTQDPPCNMHVHFRRISFVTFNHLLRGRVEVGFGWLLVQSVTHSQCLSYANVTTPTRQGSEISAPVG